MSAATTTGNVISYKRPEAFFFDESANTILPKLYTIWVGVTPKRPTV